VVATFNSNKEASNHTSVSGPEFRGRLRPTQNPESLSAFEALSLNKEDKPSVAIVSDATQYVIRFAGDSGVA
jgi:hypothetical protein